MFRNFDSQKRSHESPMDFEWQTQAPMDPTSPFAQSRPLKSKYPPSNEGTRLTAPGAFDSQPPKNSFISASTTPAPQFRNPSFTTPRKPFEPELFSEQSGIESSPGEVGDAEDTPDPPQSSQAMTAFSNGGTIRQPIFGKYGAGFQGPSPGHREQRRGKYGNAIVQKMRKRKRLERDYGLSREMQQYDSESDDDGTRPKSRGGGKRDKSEPPANPSPGLIAGFFNYIEAHPHLPNILSYYAQMTVNFFVVFLGIYAVYSMWMTIRADVDKASEGERAILIAEMAKCAKDFVNNGCAKAGKAPALEIPCNEWEHCMNQDPASVGRARISAHTFADILNSFIEPISWKAMVSTSLTPPSPISFPFHSKPFYYIQ